MSLEQLFDHTAEIYSSTPGSTSVDDYGDTAPGFGNAVTELCTVVPPKLAERDYGPGQTPGGRLDAYFRMGVVLAARDVVKLIHGPEAPSTWIVDGPPSHPRGHHVEVSLIPWTGTPTP